MVDSIERTSSAPPLRGPHSHLSPLPTAAELAPVLEALGQSLDTLLPLGDPGPRGPRFHVVGPEEVLVGKRLRTLDADLGETDALLLVIMGPAEPGRLATWRNTLWPLLHVNRLATLDQGALTLRTLGDKERSTVACDLKLSVLVGHRRAHVMSAGETVTKFDQNATGWDGRPGSAGYPHFRWMRRHVGRFVAPRLVRDDPAGQIRILDFGCGAGWTGLEAAAACPGAHLSSFDPSPEMVRITGENAAKLGIESFEGRPGFGEAPPFPAEGEDPYDLVISSGVVSFSPDVPGWLDGLVATMAPGADLIIGDINPHSRGFERRRRRKPLLPVREMNARPREEIRRELEARGLVHLRSGAYQLTRPIPEAMHVSETRLGGVLTHPLLAANRIATFVDASFGSPMQDHFDSWVMHLRRPEEAS
ncbi:MAG: class I SAM-dependent methyltransferase [Planctomycetes bacterium]|nr:class I SAM-dependent methyltransferase [Planctomycetota bacterium]